ncbi:Uncharacterized membrane protein [Pedobacter steynii]|uniref:Uncharacterized membrane protein n=1 Tax=Pedobacter steynii TaxID=430522 RepID=A0A1H0J2N4_9SPHI|nr:hypothetical protein [Pedobacter steynii]NQX43013.1 hypothetical protein [Pedobacter steynii]SDO37965.1 Uncharacterized membrane protein [Pedobacter steynii]
METNFNSSTDDGKTVAIVSYITLIGWLVAYFAMHKDKRTELGSFHLRQTLLLFLIVLALNIGLSIFVAIMPFDAGLIYKIVYLGIFILWVIGFIGAIQGEKKEMPLIGKAAQTMFPNL